MHDLDDKHSSLSFSPSSSVATCYVPAWPGLLLLAMVADSTELATAMDDYWRLEMKYWHFDGLILDPVFDRHREHPAMRALEAKYSRKAPDA